jgi:hypothetical protein
VQLDPTLDAMVVLNIALAISDEVRELFGEVQKQIESDEQERPPGTSPRGTS